METDIEIYKNNMMGLLSGMGAAYLLYKPINRSTDTDEHDRRMSSNEYGSCVEVAPGNSHTIQADASGLNIISSCDDMDTQHLRRLLAILKQNPNPTLKVLIGTGVCRLAAFSGNHELIHSEGGISIVVESLNDPLTEVKVDALNALNFLSNNVANREIIQEYVDQVCELVHTAITDSALQFSTLRLLSNLLHNHQNQLKVKRSIPEVFELLHKGSTQTKAQIMCAIPDILKGHLTFVANLNESRRSPHCESARHEYSEESLSALLFGSSQFSNELFSLMTHPDNGVFFLTTKILTKLQ
ncbi:armadillo repeat-containing X-linked protein 1-like [Carcharodon carcharias]|uniref:armadillo repeat-containing X-linked protein 1-like n=1 Tax=Carcharodon carcharias TaxID=13397 RepID=UPI001B7ED123|nr:armadillo repeat-containing X-linked protein 1-like [Carcharodon carcharias]